MRSRVALILVILGLLMAVTAAPVAAGAPAVLVMTKSDSPDPVLPGGSLTYTVTVQNVGQSDATNVSVNDTFPAGLTALSATVSQGTATLTVADVAWTVGTVAQGVVVLMTINLFVAGGLPAGTVLTNVANGSSAQTGPFSASASTTVGPLSDLAITKIDSPDPVVAGGTIFYTVTVQNLGPHDAIGVSWSDTFPAGTSLSVAGVLPPNWTCLLIANTQTCDYNVDLTTADGPQAFSFGLSVDAGTPNGTVISNSATVTSTTVDPTPGNNSASAQTTVVVPPATPVASNLPNASTTNHGTSPLATLGFVVLLLGALGTLAVVSRRRAVRRS